MQYRMTVDNSRLGITYAVTLRPLDSGWVAVWQATYSSGLPVEGKGGSIKSDDVETAFRQMKRLLEDHDQDIIDVDWQFEEPLPPWMTE